MSKNCFVFKFLVAKEKEEELAAPPPAEDTGDVDDLVCIWDFFLFVTPQNALLGLQILN